MAKPVFKVEYYYGHSHWDVEFKTLNEAVKFIDTLPNRKSWKGTVLPFTQAKILKNNTYLNEIPEAL